MAGLPPKHPRQAPRHRPLRGLDASHGEAKQAGKGGGAESVSVASSLPFEQRLVEAWDLPAKGRCFLAARSCWAGVGFWGKGHGEGAFPCVGLGEMRRWEATACFLPEAQEHWPLAESTWKAAQHSRWLPPALGKLRGRLWATSALSALRSCSLRVASKLPAANLLLLERLLSLLQHIGHNASTSRMSCSNLAICVGPNLLSAGNEDLLSLEAMLEVTEKVGCTEQAAAAFPAHQSLAVQRSLAAPSLRQMLVGRLPARAAPQRQPSVQRQGSGVGKAA